MTATMAPGLAAAMSEKPGADAKLGIPNAPQRRSRFKVPALKNLVKGDAVVAMLRSILNFLKLRFPVALTGTNVLLSLAVFRTSALVHYRQWLTRCSALVCFLVLPQAW
jgi:hypothetical protein